jgi:hypothetical protein
VIIVVSVLAVACSSNTDEPTTVPTSTTSTPTTAPATTSTTASTTEPSTTPSADELVVTIVAPPPLSTQEATIDLGDGRLAAPVRLEADVVVPAGESVEIAWASDVDGPLGGGATLDAELSNDRRDIVSHIIMVRAVSSGGSRGTATVEVIVRVPSN